MNRDVQSDEAQAAAMSDADVERLLGDAYAAPSVPKSLLKRLDRAVAEQWGESPKVTPSEPNWLASAPRRIARSWKTWPIAACAALALVLAVSFRGHAHAYSWAAVVQAMSQQNVVQLGAVGAGESASSWMSLSEKKIGQRFGDVERLYDLRQGTVLERGTSEARIKRFKLSDVSDASALDRVALSFLVGDLEVEADILQLPEVRLESESWKRTGDAIELNAAFGTGPLGSEVQLTLVIDAQTHLPESCLVRTNDGAVRRQVVTYPPARAEQLIAAAFPADLPIVDVTNIGATVEPSAVAVLRPESAAASNGSAENAAAAQPQPGGGNPQAVTLTGAASLGWSPIVASRLTSDEAVAEINVTLERLWREHGIEPVAPASDAELLRRVYLDLTGRTPSVTEVRNYLNDTSPDRYTKLVDHLLGRADHATHLATVWRTFLLPEGVDLARFGGVPAFDEWLSGRFGENVPYDQLVRELLLAEGRLSQSGPLLFYSALKLDADQIAARTARVFLGMRLDCAQCHDDPFEPWTQEDFWSYAAFFARISRPQAALESVSTVMRVRDIDRGEVMMPDSDDPVAPKFLDGSIREESQEGAVRRQQLAQWLTGPDNPYFARAAVNRVWAHMFGRGIVDPVDGFGKRHPPLAPELLDLLAAQFIADDFDLRATFRTIALSRAYQLSSGAQTDDPERREWLAQMNVKMLTAEQIYDCITVASMLVPADSNGFSIARVGNSSRDEFLLQFQTLAGRPTEYQAGIPQALTLMNGRLISSATDLAGSGLLKSLEAPFFTDDQRIEVIYLATLSRRPAPAEWQLLREYVSDRDPAASIQEPLADILWALLNGAEFTMNH